MTIPKKCRVKPALCLLHSLRGTMPEDEILIRPKYKSSQSPMWERRFQLPSPIWVDHWANWVRCDGMSEKQVKPRSRRIRLSCICPPMAANRSPMRPLPRRRMTATREWNFPRACKPMPLASWLKAVTISFSTSQTPISP